MAAQSTAAQLPPAPPEPSGTQLGQQAPGSVIDLKPGPQPMEMHATSQMGPLPPLAAPPLLGSHVGQQSPGLRTETPLQAISGHPTSHVLPPELTAPPELTEPPELTAPPELTEPPLAPFPRPS